MLGPKTFFQTALLEEETEQSHVAQGHQVEIGHIEGQLGQDQDPGPDLDQGHESTGCRTGQGQVHQNRQEDYDVQQ